MKLKFLGSQVTTDAGLLAYRELDEVLGLTEMAQHALQDSRVGSNKQHGLSPLLRQSIYGRLAGYEDVNDAERLCVDPALRHVVGGRATLPENQAASTSEVGRFETEMLSPAQSDGADESPWPMDRPGPSAAAAQTTDPRYGQLGQRDLRKATGHGLQRALPLPLLPSAVSVQPVRRLGTSHAAARQQRQRKFWRRVLLPVIERYRHLGIPKFFRGDAAFANPALYRVLEEEGYRYAIRIKANAVLEREIEHLLKRPVGRPSHKPKVFYYSFQYQAKSWQQSRLVVAKIEWHAGELFAHVGFIVTNLSWRSKNVVKFYNGRGTSEQWIKEGKNAVKWTKLSCRTFKDNQARLQLFALAYNLGNFLRRLALPKPVRHWSLTTLREKLIKIGAKVTRHSKYVTFQLAEVAVTRNLFAAILDRIARLAMPPPVACRMYT